MLLMGDEMGRSQQGNNNAYCQDNPISWLDWSGLHTHAELHRFVKGLIALRAQRESVRDAPSLSLEQLMTLVRVQLHGVHLRQPDLQNTSHSLAVTASSLSGDLRMHFALNAYWEPLAFDLPPGLAWRRVLDTSRPSPQDLVDFEHAEAVDGTSHSVAPRSVVALFARASPA
jgi:glycogen operon protein